MKPVALVQARVGSARLPGKVLALISGRTMLERVVERCRMSRALGGVAIVTSDRPEDDAVAEISFRLGADVFRGSEHDVLDRYVRAIDGWSLQTIVRITADCPLVDPAIIDEVVARQEQSGADYACVDGYPNGLGAAEVVTTDALHRAHRESHPNETYYREHVISYLLDHPGLFQLDLSLAPEALRRPDVRLSVDEAPDLDLVRFVYESFAPRTDCSTAEILQLLDEHPDVAHMNAHVVQKDR